MRAPVLYREICATESQIAVPLVQLFLFLHPNAGFNKYFSFFFPVRFGLDKINFYIEF